MRAAGGYPEPIHSVVVPLLAGLFDPAVQGEAYDPAGANRLLDGAGYRRDSDGVRAKNGHRLEFRITAQSGQVDDEIAEQVIIAQLQPPDSRQQDRDKLSRGPVSRRLRSALWPLGDCSGPGLQRLLRNTRP